jgi:putative transposase
MKKSRFNETQISHAINEHEAGNKTSDICQELSISQNTFYLWNPLPLNFTLNND